LIDDRQLHVPSAKRSSLQFHTVSTCRKTKGQRDVQKAASGALAKWQLEESVGAALAQLKAQAAAMALSRMAVRALQSIVRRSVRSGKPADGAVAEALELWQATKAALQTLADEKHVTDRQSWVQVADIVHSCVGQTGEALLAQVGRSVAAWEETKKQQLEQQKAEQSIWETSGNATSQMAGETQAKAKSVPSLAGKDKYWEEMNNAEQAAAVLLGWESVSEPATSVCGYAVSMRNAHPPLQTFF
jgi:hypothetical protein